MIAATEDGSKFSGATDRKPRFGFILKPEFPMNAFILATETLRIANQNSGRDIFEWVTICETEEAVRASNGMRIEPDHPLANFPRCDFVVLLDGNPLENIANARRIQGTMLRGQWLDRARLDAMEQSVAAAVRAM